MCEIKQSRSIKICERDYFTLLWRKRIKRALEARGYLGNDDTSLTLQPLCAPVNERDDGTRVGITVLIILDLLH